MFQRRQPLAGVCCGHHGGRKATVIVGENLRRCTVVLVAALRRLRRVSIVVCLMTCLVVYRVMRGAGTGCEAEQQGTAAIPVTEFVQGPTCNRRGHKTCGYQPPRSQEHAQQYHGQPGRQAVAASLGRVCRVLFHGGFSFIGYGVTRPYSLPLRFRRQ